MRRTKAIAALALTAGLVAVAPSSVSAAHRGHHRPPPVPELHIRAAHGYRISVGERLGAVALSVARRHGRHGGSATTYVARGVATPHGLEASFGRFGRISMRFHPTAAKAHLPHGRCHGPLTPLIRPGLFLGNLRFRGENGYVSVKAHRARGQTSQLSIHCIRKYIRHHHQHARESLIRSASGRGTGKEVTYLAALSKTATSSESFVALKLGKRPAFIALSSDNAGKVSRFHVAVTFGTKHSFRLNDALTSGLVTPGRPFSGSAGYVAAPDGTRTWEGPLAVDFPGTPHFALTGPPLETEVGTLPLTFVFFLLKQAKAGDAVSLAATEKPSLLSALGG